MFLDDVIALVAKGADYVRDGSSVLPPTLNSRFQKMTMEGVKPEEVALRGLNSMRRPDALRLVLSPSALDTIDETCSSPTLVAAARRSVLLPASSLWVEWRSNGQTVGVAFQCRSGSERVAGSGSITIRLADELIGGAFKFDLHAPNFLSWSLIADHYDQPKAAAGLERLATGLSALWASPRMIEVERVETPPRLAAARAKRGKPALSEYSVVHLSKAAATARNDGATGTGDGARRRGHRVRGHLRLLGTGRIVPVRPHERGDRDRPMSGNVRVVG